MAGLSLWAAGESALATGSAAGFDQWHTLDGEFNIVLPPDFFGPGSDPFTGPIRLEGVPIDPPNSGNADTIVERLGDTPTGGGQVQIEIVELHLQSIDPFQVDTDTGTQQWLLDVTIDPGQPKDQGIMEIIPINPDGGAFQSVLPVRPLFEFIRLDAIAPTITIPANAIDILTNPSLPTPPWSHTPAPDYPPFLLAGGFHPGVDFLSPGHDERVPVGFEVLPAGASLPELPTIQSGFLIAEPAAIPLPAAAWAGLALLGGLGGVRGLRRRTRCRLRR
jgi:hypothetical protein